MVTVKLSPSAVSSTGSLFQRQERGVPPLVTVRVAEPMASQLTLVWLATTAGRAFTATSMTLEVLEQPFSSVTTTA